MEEQHKECFYHCLTNVRILKANLSWTRKKSNSSDAKKLRLCLYLSFLHEKPDFRYSSL